ncbi:MAG: NAD(P)H-hydrate dehydratase [Clostridiales bacterium]|nr:NAD(P)H-hydrate dehydratase [Clostridiales bacterium]
MRILTVENSRHVEKLATDRGLTYLQLMDNAGSRCALIIKNTFESTNRRRVLIICGNGNNGGDGFVIARKLFQYDYDVTIMLANGLPGTDISEEMLSTAREMGVPIVYYDWLNNQNSIIDNSQIIVDCIFGVGFHGEIDEKLSPLFYEINRSSATKISIDVPSGLNGNGGTVCDCCIKPDMTIAVMCLKPVHVLKPTSKICGKVVVADIGIPEDCMNRAESTLFTLSEDEIKSFFIKREYESNKGTYGTVLIIGGSYEMPNAAVMASKAAVYSGAGIIKVAFPDKAYPAIAPKTMEQVLVPLYSDNKGRISVNSLQRIADEMKKCSCIAIGPGMGISKDTKVITEYIIKNSPVPVVIDADAINCIKDNISVLDEAKSPMILTPHPGEMARLADIPVETIMENRGACVKGFTDAHKAILVLKGSSTLVGSSEHEEIYVNNTGNPGMATGGSGDVLTGIIASFIAQGIDPYESAVAAVYLHGDAGDLVTKEHSMMGNTPSRIIDVLPDILKKTE